MKYLEESTTRELLSPEEVARYLGCGRTYVFNLIAAGEIPSFKLGQLRKIRRSDVESFVDRLESQWKS